MRSRGAVVFALLGGLALAGCGGGGSGARPATSRAGPIRMALTGIGSLDPARADTAQDTELDWALYAGLVTYRHARGEAGTELIPGVATALPTVTDGGRLYAMTLRRGLRFSNGGTVQASDVVATFERAIATEDSPVRPLLLPVLQGASSFAAGRATSISGVTADDATGEVTIRLRRADPGFEALLAEPALGIVPAGTPVRDSPGHPPPGVGPYRLSDVAPGRSFTLQRNPFWNAVPGIPAGQVDIEVTLSRDGAANALAVLNDVLDIADPAQGLPLSTLAEIRRQGVGRARLVADGRPVAYLFLDAHAAPFEDRLAREGVVEGLGALTPARAGARTLAAVCDAVPEVSSGRTPVGCPSPVTSGGALASARSLVARSGTAGAPVVVWSPRTGPQRAWLRDEAAVLRSIGYQAGVVTVPDATYRSEITALVPHRVAGRTTGRSPGVGPLKAHHTDKSADGPPLETIPAVVGGRLAASIRIPVQNAVVVAISSDVTLTRARRAHMATLAEQAVPELMSWRMDQSGAVIDPVDGIDLTSLRLR
ncbi:MAG TPA: ABC transporter substrate-binding protein [Solirubrobacteraceae bacterium]|jgi:peptide/nickel transport system substrate-binding protein